jgi:hypothetical protein
MLIRRLRGLLATIVGGAFVGGAAGTVIGLLFLFVPGPKTITVTPQFPGAVLIVPAAWGAAIGALSGGTFGLLLMMAERGRGIDDLRASRVATWAVVASAAALRLGGASWTLVGLGSGLAAGIGIGATLLAKRGRGVAATAEAFPPST